jgi:hypothetical protein
MKYRIKIKYWCGWSEDYTTLENIIYASDYVEAVRIAINQFVDFDESDIDEIDVEMIE